jgi:methyl-accepting chemotaxis protein
MTDTAQLQRLTDEQVSARLAAYNAGGSLDRDLELFSDRVLEFVVAEIRAQFGPERAERYGEIYTRKVDASWIQSIAEYGRQIFRNHTSVPEYLADRLAIANRVFAALTESYHSEPRQLASCMSA